jgi:uncharacterized protein
MTSLEFNVAQLLKSPVGATRSYDFSLDEPLDLDGTVARDLEGNVKFTLTNFGILAHGTATASLELTCARCLESFRTPADVEFDEEFEPSIDIATGLPVEGPKNDNAFSISANHTIDLGEALRQHLLLAVELVPVCDVACKGLCANCGANLNNGPCACPPPEEPSPFAALQALLADSNSDT